MSSSTEVARPEGAGGRLILDYRPPSGVYDEMAGPGGAVRPHWQPVVSALDAMGSAALARQWEQAKRLIHENGVSFNVHGDTSGMERPWALDAIPLVIPSTEWNDVAEGLAQRARLLDLILADVYGPQRLLSSNLLPPELVFGNPSFLRPCHGMVLPQERHLHLYAADLARAPDGSWWVLGDRTQSPSGAGYALENRLVISRMLPGIFHECHVQRLAPYFREMRETLRSLAPQNRDNPRIVLWSSGPRHPRYFEDAYLARYLGATLVEGGDLTVRDHAVCLKSLGGLLPVDVILRRVNDEHCDPLELVGDSTLGVAGIVQAVRRGHVALANALGSSWAESPALLAFLPGLCRHMLGEELRMPSVATWWCGQEKELKFVLENLHRLVVKPTHPRPGAESVFGEQLTSRERARLAAKIQANPRDYVAQEEVRRSSAPVWVDGKLKPWHVAIRAYLVSAGGSYITMHGALAQMSAAIDPLNTPSLVEGSKDAWVLAEGPVSPVSLLQPAGQPVPLRRSGSDLPSRVADNLFWLGRHVERADSSVRLLRAILARLTSESEVESVSELPALFGVLVRDGRIRPVVDSMRLMVPTAVEELRQFVFNDQRPNSLGTMLKTAERLASTVRDRISIDSWRILNRLPEQLEPARAAQTPQLSDVLEALDHLVIDLAAFSGLVMESMTRGPAWTFLDMGRRLEQSMQLIMLIRSTLVYPYSGEDPLLEALLEVVDSSMTYRSRYRATLQAAPVLDLVLSDETNPRSLAFQLSALNDHVVHLPRDPSSPERSDEQRIMMSAWTNLMLADPAALAEVGSDGRRAELEDLMSRLTAQLPSLSERITSKYLIHAGPLRQLANISPDRVP